MDGVHEGQEGRPDLPASVRACCDADQVRKTIKTRGHFPTEYAARTLIYLSIVNAERSWRKPLAGTPRSSRSNSLWRPTALNDEPDLVHRNSDSRAAGRLAVGRARAWRARPTARALLRRRPARPGLAELGDCATARPF